SGNVVQGEVIDFQSADVAAGDVEEVFCLFTELHTQAQAGSETDLHAIENRSADVSEIGNACARRGANMDRTRLNGSTGRQANLHQKNTLCASGITTNVQINGYICRAGMNTRSISGMDLVTHDEQTTGAVNGCRYKATYACRSTSQPIGVINKDVHRL